MDEINNENLGDEFLNQNNKRRKSLITTTIRETQHQVPPIFELLLNADGSSSASLRSATVWGGEKCIVRCGIGEESRRAFIPSTLLLHKNGKRVGIIEDESGGSIAYEFIPWEEEIKQNQKENKIKNNQNKKPILFHCSAEIFPDEAFKRKGRRHFPQTSKNIIYQRTLRMTPKIGSIPCENNIKGNYCKNEGFCFEMNNNGSRHCLCPEKYGGRYCEKWLGNGILFNSTFLPLSTLGFSSLIALLLLIIIILSLFLLKEKRKSSKRRKNIIKYENNKNENNSTKLGEKENESTPLEYFYNTKDDPFDNKFSSQQETNEYNKSLEINENNNKQKYLLPLSPIPPIASPSFSRIPRLYSNPQIKRTAKEIEKEEINFEEEKHSNSSNNESSGSGGEYDNLEKLCAEIQKQKNVLETKRMECKQNNNGGSAYMNLILLGKGENEN